MVMCSQQYTFLIPLIATVLLHCHECIASYFLLFFYCLLYLPLRPSINFVLNHCKWGLIRESSVLGLRSELR